MTTLSNLARGTGTLGSLARASLSPSERRGRLLRRPARANWSGAVSNRLVDDWFATLASPDEEMRWSVERLRARCRDLSRNNPYLEMFLELLSSNVVGPDGIRLQAQVRNNDDKLAKRMNDRIEDAWYAWGERPTIDGRLSFVGVQQLALETVATDGELFFRKHVGFGNEFAFALEPIDADLLDVNLNQAAGRNGGEIRMGVEIDAFGGPAAYWFWDGVEPVRSRRRIPAAEVVHLYSPRRFYQSRGLPWFGSSMLPLREVETYQETAVIAARIGAAQMAFLTRKAEGEGEGIEGNEDGEISMEVQPGQIPVAPDGYEVASWSPNHPNTNHAEFVKTELRRVASALRVSYNALCNDLEGVNYSSIRAGLLVERDRWRKLQTWWIDAFLRPVYREWLASATLSGALVLDSRDFRRFLNVRWFPRGWAWVDPLKDTQAGVEGIKNGLTSRRVLLSEQGLDVEEVFEDLAREKELADELGIEISEPAATTAPASPEPSTEEQPNAAIESRLSIGLGTLAGKAGRNGRVHR